MIPIGYNIKEVRKKPDYLQADGVLDIYSVSGCISKNITGTLTDWELNPYGFLNSVDGLLNRNKVLNSSSAQLFFYEMYSMQYDDLDQKWITFEPIKEVISNILQPKNFTLEGFDVVSFSVGEIPECSLLSCNHMAAEVDVNKHCLLSSMQEAISLVDSNFFAGCEPGPYRVFSVKSVRYE